MLTILDKDVRYKHGCLVLVSLHHGSIFRPRFQISRSKSWRILLYGFFEHLLFEMRKTFTAWSAIFNTLELQRSHRALQAHLRGPWIAPEPKEHNIFTISTSHATLLPASSHPAIVNFLAAWRFCSGVHIFWLVRKWKGIFVFDPKIEAMIQYLQK